MFDVEFERKRKTLYDLLKISEARSLETFFFFSSPIRIYRLHSDSTSNHDSGYISFSYTYHTYLNQYPNVVLLCSVSRQDVRNWHAQSNQSHSLPFISSLNFNVKKRHLQGFPDQIALEYLLDLICCCLPHPTDTIKLLAFVTENHPPPPGVHWRQT